MKSLRLFVYFACFIPCLSQQFLSSDCDCPRQFLPQCGSDLRTYDNQCRLECAMRFAPALRLAYPGTCCPPPFCPPFAQPVCDSLAHTHVNECTFRYNNCVMKKSTALIIQVGEHS